MCAQQGNHTTVSKPIFKFLTLQQAATYNLCSLCLPLQLPNQVAAQQQRKTEIHARVAP
jgi:hypothetical protein